MLKQELSLDILAVLHIYLEVQLKSVTSGISCAALFSELDAVLLPSSSSSSVDKLFFFVREGSLSPNGQFLLRLSSLLALVECETFPSCSYIGDCSVEGWEFCGACG
jgi:hypothetical protein